MKLSVFDLFSIGIGPSSSHTIGPMRAAIQFISTLESMGIFEEITAINIKLYGSLAFTGSGHGTFKALLMGLEGQMPDTVDPDWMTKRSQEICDQRSVSLLGKKSISFDPEKNIQCVFKKRLKAYSNGMHFFAYGKKHRLLFEKIYYSIGGGFITTNHIKESSHFKKTEHLPYPFETSKELFDLCHKHHLRPYQIVLANEKTERSKKEIFDQVAKITQVMHDAIEKGCHATGFLPGGLNVTRRASHLYKKLSKKHNGKESSNISWLQTYALAVSEENAAGGRVVTAPTSGAAGIIPAVLEYYKNNFHPVTKEKVMEFLLTAGAIAILYKTKASISGAEVGCQGEVGVACSMAAGALTAVLGGNVDQIEKAAEMAMEHQLGLTCDPVKGLVQIPCIERNAIASVTAVSAAKLTLLETGRHLVSLDNVIKTMLQTGLDMKTEYKETSLGGLAVNFPAC